MPTSFFIVGAPRCGTTSLSTYLAEHPDVCFSTPKESHHFALFGASAPAGAALREEYLSRFFPDLSPTHRAIGEGSPSYLYLPDAIDRILELFPDARFIAMVRNPMEMVPSHHSRMLFTLEEDREDFRKAWDLRRARANGDRVPATCRDPRLLQYETVGRLGSHLEALFERVPRERCFVSVYDDFAADPGKIYRDVLSFLELSDDERTSFPIRRPNRRYRSRRLQVLVKRHPAKLARFAPKTLLVKQVGNTKKKPAVVRLRKWVRFRNKLREERPPLDPDVRRTLQETFAEDVEKLGALLGRDLSHWS